MQPGMAACHVGVSGCESRLCSGSPLLAKAYPGRQQVTWVEFPFPGSGLAQQAFGGMNQWTEDLLSQSLSLCLSS